MAGSPRAPWREQAAVVAAVSLGGGAGALARYGAGRLWPSGPGSGHGVFPWTTVAVNVLGCLLIGVLLTVAGAAAAGTPAAHRLVRPFLGTGVLGGFTTFSAAMLDTERLLRDGRPSLAFGCLALTAVAALAAVWLGAAAARAVTVSRKGRPAAAPAAPPATEPAAEPAAEAPAARPDRSGA
ncbi:CrcB family protein [Streptomyces sp. 7-21]|uniref:fluoride efflux transporter FluC n=1 Tax=Streptomyces sp. 7-21 TaxID=2802283 RepID=UPI00191E14E5|nr:CrcB family protein [Streptomyces sp. 7-21]MBL1067615.1 CrcB family protein [Streptomyces sp. 7-21]